MKRLLLSFLIFTCCQFSWAQYNLIADSSFEHNKFIPVEYSSIGASTSWNSPSRGTPDLFCKCGKKQKKISRVNVPENPMGIQEANTGKCYAGIFAVSHGYYREYIQTTLVSALQPNKIYELNMYVSLSDYSPLAIDKLGVCFLTGSVKQEHSDVIRNLQPVYIPLEDEVGMETNEWHKLTIHYKAKGGENTLLIGGFAIKRLWKTGNTVPDGMSSPIWKKYERDAYYYIDDISIREFKPEVIDTTEAPENPYFALMKEDSVATEIVAPDTISKFSSETIFVFKNLLFKSGEAVLANNSNSELNIIAGYMKVDPKLKIEVYGHTDNAGDENRNKELSYNRAKAVATYLIAKGIKPENISYQGFGSSKPIDTNETEEGRKNNRRVEFKLLKK
jgi:OOP family OmpA-OmpF porin